MKNDIDPTQMKLSEIYQLPDYYFTLKDQLAMPHYGIKFDRYQGYKLRSNGTKFFTIKMDDRWQNLSGEHSYTCSMCTESECPPSMLGLHAEDTRRPHP